MLFLVVCFDRFLFSRPAKIKNNGTSFQNIWVVTEIKIKCMLFENGFQILTNSSSNKDDVELFVDAHDLRTERNPDIIGILDLSP